MAIFGAKNKDGSPCVNMIAYDGIQRFYKGLALSLTITDTCLEIKPRIGKTPQPATLSYGQIVDAELLTEDEIIEKSKNVIGRAVVGHLFLGKLGAVIGGMSGVGVKKEIERHSYLIINYTPANGSEVDAISFEVCGATFGLDEFVKSLRERSGLSLSMDNLNEILTL